MLKINSCIYIGEKFSRKKSESPPFGLKIAGNHLKRPDIQIGKCYYNMKARVFTYH